MVQNSIILSFCGFCVTELKALWSHISVFLRGRNKSMVHPGGVARGAATLHLAEQGRIALIPAQKLTEGWPDILCNCKWYLNYCKGRWVSMKAGCHGWHMPCHECLRVRSREKECLITFCSSFQASIGISSPRSSSSSRFFWTCHPFCLEAPPLLPVGFGFDSMRRGKANFKFPEATVGSMGICDMPAARWSSQ